MKKRATRKPTTKKALPAPGMEAFHTRSRANEGHKLPLFTPTGEQTAHWVQVRGADSDAFRMEKFRQERKAAELSTLADGEREAAVAESILCVIASLVADWSFDMPATPENVRDFLREAPQIASKIEEFASRRAFFFKLPSKDLKTTPAPSST